MNVINPPSRLDELWNAIVPLYTQGTKKRSPIMDIGVHGYDHVYRVWGNVIKIKDENDIRGQVNYELIQAAAILHDIGYLHIVNDNPTAEDHVKKSMRMSKKFLQSLLFTSEEARIVQKTISGHHCNKYDQLSLEQKVLLIADQLDLLGLDGTLREFIRASSKNQNRDEMAKMILQKSRQRYTKLIGLKIGRKLVKEKWRQSKQYLQKIINTGPRITGM